MKYLNALFISILVLFGCSSDKQEASFDVSNFTQQIDCSAIDDAFKAIAAYSKQEMEDLGEEIILTGQYASLYLKEEQVFKEIEQANLSEKDFEQAFKSSLLENHANDKKLQLFKYYSDLDLVEDQFSLNVYQADLNKLYSLGEINLEDYRNLSLFFMIFSLTHK